MADTDPVTAALDQIRQRDKAVAMGHVRDPEDVPRLLAAVEAVLAIHDSVIAVSAPVCAYCKRAYGEHEDWPCVTYEAISAALLGEGESGG